MEQKKTIAKIEKGQEIFIEPFIKEYLSKEIEKISELNWHEWMKKSHYEEIMAVINMPESIQTPNYEHKINYKIRQNENNESIINNIIKENKIEIHKKMLSELVDKINNYEIDKDEIFKETIENPFDPDKEDEIENWEEFFEKWDNENVPDNYIYFGIVEPDSVGVKYADEEIQNLWEDIEEYEILDEKNIDQYEFAEYVAAYYKADTVTIDYSTYFGTKCFYKKISNFNQNEKDFINAIKLFNGKDLKEIEEIVKKEKLSYGMFSPNIIGSAGMLDINYKSVTLTIKFKGEVMNNYEGWDEDIDDITPKTNQMLDEKLYQKYISLTTKYNK